MSKWYTEKPMGSVNLVVVWDGRGPLPASFGADCDFHNPARVVAKTTVDGADVSTVLMFLDHAWADGAVGPLVYETMVFGGEHDGDCERYRTRTEAEAGHARIVASLAEGPAP